MVNEVASNFVQELSLKKIQEKINSLVSYDVITKLSLIDIYQSSPLNPKGLFGTLDKIRSDRIRIDCIRPNKILVLYNIW